MVERVSVPDTRFLDGLERVRHDGNARWRDNDGTRLYEWDFVHGHFEVYNKRGRHLGVVDTHGRRIGDAIAGRTIDV